MLIWIASAQAFESDPVPVHLQDEAELFTNYEYSTGVLPSGSPVGVEFAIEANGGAAVEMDGEGDLTWPEAVTLAFTGEAGSGIYLLDASLDAVTTVVVDLSDYGYEGEFEIDRRTITMDGATFFDPFVMDGAADDRVEVIDEAAGTELITYSYDIFLGVSLEFTADMTPTFTAGFEGVSWTVNEGSILAEGAPAVLEPTRSADFDVDSTFTARWDATFDLVFTPTLSVCGPIFGCIDIASFDIPVELLTDEFDQDFPSAVYAFPMPMLVPGIDSGDFGTIEPGEIANLQVPLGNQGNLACYGEATIEGDGEFTVYPNQFNALPATTDGLTVTFAPTADGEQTADLVLTSNDPSYPTLVIPLTGNAVTPDDPGSDEAGDEEIITSKSDSVCGCSSTQAGAPVGALLAAAVLLSRRRRA
jgi:MYXO-CTERM domain-containing protein